MKPTSSAFRLPVACVLLLGFAVALRAYQGRGGGAAGPTPVPTSASSLAAHPQVYIGQLVTMTAAVEKQISFTVFTVDQDRTKSLPDEVLVIAPTLTTPPPANAYVSVIGDAIAFDPATVAAKLKGYTLSLPPDIIEKYKGKPAVLATAVVGTDMVDLAKKKPAPMTPEDETLSKIMKQVQPASGALRTAATGSDAAATREKAAELKKLFTDAQAVFKTKNMTDAVGWTTDAIKFADAADAGAAAGKWPDVTAAATSLNGLCGPCHTAHRERQDDGTYRLK